MAIQKDAEWLRLEGKVGQLAGSLRDAELALRVHARKMVAKHLGLVPGETVVTDPKGERYIVSEVDGGEWSMWVYGCKIRKDGKPAEREQCLYDNWQKVV